MRIARYLAILSFAIILFCGASFADSFNFSSKGSGDLGSNQETFTSVSGTSTITVWGFSDSAVPVGTDLYYKTSGGDETGLGLVGTSDHEIGTTHFIELADAGLSSLTIGSVQSGEGWILYGSNTAGVRGTTILAQGNTTTINLSGIDSGFKYISLEAKSGDVLLDSAALAVPEPGVPAMLMTLGLVSLFAFGGRKLGRLAA